MKFRLFSALIAFVVLALATTACGSATPTPRPTPTNAPPTTAPTQPPPTATATLPPTATPTQTPIPVQATAKQDVNTRKGPGLEYAIAQKMTKGAQANVVGKNADGKWLQIAFPDAANPSWVSATFLTVTGPADTVQVVQVAPVATATRGAVTTTAKTTPTTTPQVFAAPHGSIGFIYSEAASSSLIVGGVSVDSPHTVYPLEKLGPPKGSFDVNQDTRTNVPPYAWSPDYSILLYVFNTSGGQSSPDKLQYNKGASLGDPPTSVDSHGCISSPGWVDNKNVVFIGMDGPGCTIQKIYKMALDGSTAQSDRILYTPQGSESLRGLAWGPFVLYVSNLSGQQEIWRMNQDGTGPTQITTDKRENGSPAWSPDGKYFAYYSKQADGSTQIVVRNADGSNPRKLTNQGNNYSPTWSPDSNWIAFSSDRGGGRTDIYIMNKNGGQVVQLTDKSPVGGAFPGAWH